MRECSAAGWCSRAELKPTTGATVMGFDLLSEWTAEGGRTPFPSPTLGSSVIELRPDRTPVPANRSSCPPALRRQPRVRVKRRFSAPFSSATSSPTANTSVPKHSTCGGIPAFAAPYTNSGNVTDGPATNDVIT